MAVPSTAIAWPTTVTATAGAITVDSIATAGDTGTMVITAGIIAPRGSNTTAMAATGAITVDSIGTTGDTGATAITAGVITGKVTTVPGATGTTAVT